MKAILLLAAPALLLLVAAGLSACAEDPIYACPDPSHSCYPDAGADADAGD